jgi:hypothetical protein
MQLAQQGIDKNLAKRVNSSKADADDPTLIERISNGMTVRAD